MRAVREIEAGDIHAAANQIANHGGRAARRTKRANDLGLASYLGGLGNHFRCAHSLLIATMLNHFAISGAKAFCGRSVTKSFQLHGGNTRSAVLRAGYSHKGATKVHGDFFVTSSLSFAPSVLAPSAVTASHFGKTKALNSAPMSTTIETM